MSEAELIRACAESNDGTAWNELVSRFHRTISLSIIRIASQWGQPQRQLVDDLVQETYLKLCADRCRQLLDFSRRHPEAVTGYIKTVAINVARDHFKSAYSQKRSPGQVEESLTDIDAQAEKESLGGPAKIEHQVLLKQIDECLSDCSAGPDQDRDRIIFWLYYQQGMSAKSIAALPTVGLTAKGVESAILRLTRLIREHLVSQAVKRRLRADVGAGPRNDRDPDEKGLSPAESF